MLKITSGQLPALSRALYVGLRCWNYYHHRWPVVVFIERGMDKRIRVISHIEHLVVNYLMG